VAEERTKRLAAEARAEASQRELDRLKRELEASRETARANDQTSRVATQLLKDQNERIHGLEMDLAAARGTAPVGTEVPAAASKEKAAQPSVPIPPALARHHALDLDKPVAFVDGDPISRREFVEALYRTYGNDYLNTFVNLVLIERESRRLAIDVTPPEEDLFIDTQLAEIVKKAGGDEAFQKKVEAQGLSVAGVRSALKVHARAELLIEKLAHFSRGTPEGKEAFEKRVRQEYDKLYGEKVQARHIFVKGEATASRRDLELAEQRVRALHKRIVDGEDFERVAKEASDDVQSKSRGGDLGLFGRSQFEALPELNKVFFEMPIGEVSSPVRTEVGFHIVQVVKHVPAEKTFDASRAGIAANLEAEGLTGEENNALIARLRAKAKIERKMEPGE
jgi:foldase protein PrsA